MLSQGPILISYLYEDSWNMNPAKRNLSKQNHNPSPLIMNHNMIMNPNFDYVLPKIKNKSPNKTFLYPTILPEAPTSI